VSTICPGCGGGKRAPFALCSLCEWKESRGKPTPFPIERCEFCKEIAGTSHQPGCPRNPKRHTDCGPGCPMGCDVDDSWTGAWGA
jgi:hypothetical protein